MVRIRDNSYDILGDNCIGIERNIPKDAAVSHDKDGMMLHILFFASLVVAQIALRALLRFLEEFSKASYENAFKKRLFRELLMRDYGEVTAVHSGEWMNRLTSDTVVVEEGLSTIVPGVVGMMTRMASALVVILMIVKAFDREEESVLQD